MTPAPTNPMRIVLSFAIAGVSRAGCDHLEPQPVV